MPAEGDAGCRSVVMPDACRGDAGCLSVVMPDACRWRPVGTVSRRSDPTPRTSALPGVMSQDNGPTGYGSEIFHVRGRFQSATPDRPQCPGTSSFSDVPEHQASPMS